MKHPLFKIAYKSFRELGHDHEDALRLSRVELGLAQSRESDWESIPVDIEPIDLTEEDLLDYLEAIYYEEFH